MNLFEDDFFNSTFDSAFNQRPTSRLSSMRTTPHLQRDIARVRDARHQAKRPDAQVPRVDSKQDKIINNLLKRHPKATRAQVDAALGQAGGHGGKANDILETILENPRSHAVQRPAPRRPAPAPAAATPATRIAELERKHEVNRDGATKGLMPRLKKLEQVLGGREQVRCIDPLQQCV